MRSIISRGVAVLGVALAAGPAFAADIIEEPPVFIEPAPAPVFVESGGFYIRGDVGYVAKAKTSGDYKFWNWGHDGQQNPDGSYNYGSGTISRGVDDTFHYDSIELRDSVSFGGGVGYRFNDNFRTDVTLDYFKADVDGSSPCNYIIEGTYELDPTDNSCRYDDQADAKILLAMANAYVDIGQFGVVTPYVGAGLGLAHVKYGDMTNTIVCGEERYCDENEDYTGTHKGESSWRFAASLMAGASVDITESLIFDAGYRYTRIEGGDAFGYDGADQNYGASGVQGRDHGFDIHAVRAGLRYEFGGGGFGKGKGVVEPAPFEPAPYGSEQIVYK